MTKIQWIILGLIVVFVGGYFFIKSDDISSDDSNGSASEVEESSDRKMSFGDFVRQGGSYKCDIEQAVDGTTTSGTAYIDGGKIKGEYVTQAEGLSITSYVIVRDGYAYSWTSFAPNMGFKAKVVENAPADSTAPPSGEYSFNADDVGDYDCDAWAADASVFALPAGVKFTEINQ
ncbi:MAG: hypothetical protein WBL19_00805 [Minisyncoccia bacterium]